MACTSLGEQLSSAARIVSSASGSVIEEQTESRLRSVALASCASRLSPRCPCIATRSQESALPAVMFWWTDASTRSTSSDSAMKAAALMTNGGRSE